MIGPERRVGATMPSTLTLRCRRLIAMERSLGSMDPGTGGPGAVISAFRHREGCIDEALFFVQHATGAKLVGDVGQNPAQNLAVAPSLKPAMRRFVIRIALRQHVPLRARVQNPQRRFKNFPRRNRFTARTSFRNVLFRKMMLDALSFRIAQPNHPTLIARRRCLAILSRF